MRIDRSVHRWLVRPAVATVLAAGITFACLWSTGCRPVATTHPPVDTGAAIHSASGDDSDAAIVTVRSDRFRILLLNDMHLFEGNDGTQTMAIVAELSRRHSPDVVLLNGDSWMDETGDKGDTFSKWLCDQMVVIDKPWALVWGNHDLTATPEATDALLRNAKGSLYRGSARSGGQYRVEVHDSSGKVIWTLFCLNSGQRPKGSKLPLGLIRQQLEWFEAQAQLVKQMPASSQRSFVFVHVPLAELAILAASGHARGAMGEVVHYDNQPFDAFRAFKKSRIVLAVFCAHDHVNDFQGDYQGIFLKAGRSLGGYGAQPKGGTLIDVDARAGTFVVTSVIMDGSPLVPSTPLQKVGKLSSTQPM